MTFNKEIVNRIVITGGPGFGKSSIIKALEDKGYTVFHEISREIITDQKSKNGDVVPWKNHQAFNEAVFKGRLEQYHAATDSTKLYFFDRGLPDSLAYLMADNNDIPAHFHEEIKITPYYHRVFYTPYWEEIYVKDNERWENLEYVKKIQQNILHFYKESGYELIEIPKTTVDERVNFILESLKFDFADFMLD